MRRFDKTDMNCLHVLCMQFFWTQRELNMSFIDIFVFLSSFAFVCPSNFIDDVSVGGFLSLVKCPSQYVSVGRKQPHILISCVFLRVCNVWRMGVNQRKCMNEKYAHFICFSLHAEHRYFLVKKKQKLLHPLRIKSNCRGFTREERNEHKFGER